MASEAAMTSEHPARQIVTDVELIGEALFATGEQFAETEVGGLSGLVYDKANGIYYALSDDRSQRNPARFYTLGIDLRDGTLDEGDVAFQSVTTLLDESGVPYAENAVDPEGLALTGNGILFVSSEGNVDAEPMVPPFIREYSKTGEVVSDIPLPAIYLPNAERTSGVRNNLAFENLALSLDGRTLWTAVEGALVQDGPIADLESGSLVRVLQIDLASKQPLHEYVYVTDPIPQAPVPAGGAADNGLVDLLPLDSSGTLLTLERAYAQGVGNSVRLFQAQTSGALDVLGQESLFNAEAGVPFEMDPPVAKTLLADLGELGATLDNFEGMTFGPRLPDGRQTLILVSDNNFNDTQQTVFVALALTLEEIPTAYAALETPLTVDEADAPEGWLAGDSDDPAIYVHPDDPSQSMVLATLKDGGLVVFDLAGQMLSTVTPADYGVEYGDIRYNNVDIVYGFDLGGAAVDLAVASDRANDALAVFAIDPASRTLTDVTSPDMPATIFGVDDGEQTAYGMATYTAPETGATYVFVTQADGDQVAQLHLRDDGGDKVTAEVVRRITVPAVSDDPSDAQSEGIVVDRDLGFLYVAVEDGVEEGIAIVKYAATPEGGDNPEPLLLLPANALLPDVEGLTIYYGPEGSGYLLASSQGDSTYAVYDRAGENAYLGRFAVGGKEGIDPANESDGADLINVALGDAFPYGLLVVQDGANDPQVAAVDDEELENRSTNFKFVPWEDVANAFAPPLLIDPESYQVRPTEPTMGGAVGNQGEAQISLTVMTYNVWGGGANEGKPIDETVAAIRAAGADIIGMQETRLESDPCTAESCPATGPSVAKAIADALGFYYYDQSQTNEALWANAILSRYPIGDATPNDLGVAIDVEGRTVYVFNIHLTDFPYQPYQLLDIEYGDAPFLDNVDEAVQAATATRGPALDLLRADLNAAEGAAASFIFGDFNEPSHRDWTEAAVAAGLQPLAVPWPTTLAIERLGYTDALRTCYPDVVAKPAFTWTPTGDPLDPDDHHDRIDFVFVRGDGLVVEDAFVVGEGSPAADIIVTPWPSDHRAISARVRF